MKKTLCLFISVFAIALSGCTCLSPSHDISEFPSTHEPVALTGVASLFSEASEAYDFFAVSSAAVDEEYSIANEWGGFCYRIADDKFNTKQKMNNYLKQYFSDDIISVLWEDAPYFEYEGYLYAIERERGTNIFICNENFEEIVVSDDKIIFRADVGFDYDLDGIEDEHNVFDFVLETVDDRLIFTEFPCYW